MSKRRLDEFTEEMEAIAKAASGVMVCLYLPMDVARWNAVEGGEPAEDLHVTLAYVPGIGENEEAFEAIREAISAVADEYGPIFGCLGGNGRFNGSETSDFQDVYYASFDSPILTELRQIICTAIEAAGFDCSSKHGFTPHVTLKYLAPDEGNPTRRSGTPPFAVTMISVSSRAYRADLKLSGDRIMKEQPTSGAVHIPTAGAEKRKKKKTKKDGDQTDEQDDSDSGAPGTPAVNPDPNEPESPGWDTPPENNEDVKIEKDVALAMAAIEAVTKGFEDESESLAINALNAVMGENTVVYEIPIAKIDKMKQVVLGEVLSPDEIDSQEDTMTAEEIEKAAYYWMEHHRTVGKRHVGVMKAVPVESYIAPQDLEFDGENGKTMVKKGTWLIAVKINDDSEWKKVLSGEYNAFSVGGFGVRD